MIMQPHPPAEPEDLLHLVTFFQSKKRFLNQVNHRFQSSAVDREFIARGYDYFESLFANVPPRRNGDSYMNGHLVPVATILLEYWEYNDPEIIVAALGHDSLEDIPWVNKEVLRKEFTRRVAHIICGVSKPPRKGRRKNSVAFCKATVRKISSYGFDCVFLKCNADRAHNMLTLWGTPEQKRWKIWETEQYFLPLATKFNLDTLELRKLIAYQRRRLHIDDDEFNRIGKAGL